MSLAHERLEKLRRLRALEVAKRDELIAQAKADIANSEYRRMARPNQLPPEGDWRIWLLLCGRGFGKTWTGARYLIEKAQTSPGNYAVIGPTIAATRRVCLEGDSGIIEALGPSFNRRTQYNRSTGEITLDNGSKIFAYSADAYERILGANLSGAWCDELAAWDYEEAWSRGLMPALRKGDAQVVVTTTPQSKPLVRSLVKRDDGSVVVTRGSTYDNRDNLSNAAIEELRIRYEGTRLGRQELLGELLEDVEGALWAIGDIDAHRVSDLPEMTRIVVAVDPAVTATADSDETGIIVAGKGIDGRAYVIADRSCRVSPTEWAQRVVNTYEEFHANLIVAEKNQGGDLVETILRQVNAGLPIRTVVAKKGKALRAEPVAALYEQGRVSHVGPFDKLEAQMTEWVPDSGQSSPDRVDALVYAIMELGIGNGSTADAFLQSLAPLCPTCGFPNAVGTDQCSSCNERLTEQSRSADNFLRSSYPR
jgi:predicted phage terminase large subunit-like protein